MSTSRLELYNKALTYCGERVLASLTEVREPRYLLDLVWDMDGAEACLEMAQWKFAMRSVKFDYDTAVTPAFGYNRAFSKPTDWVLTSAFCSDEYFTTPVTRYTDENDYWYSDLDEIYIKYVSNDTSYGLDLSLWPATFANFAAAYFASEIILKLTADEKKQERIFRIMEDKKTLAKNKDAMAGPQQFPAPGNWVQSRGGRNGRRDRGNRGQLIG